MELMDLLVALTSVVCQAMQWLDRAGYSWDEGEFTELGWDADDMESFYYVRVLAKTAQVLCELNERLATAQREPKRHGHRLSRLPGGRFGYHTSEGSTVEMYCGRQIEALVDVDGHPYWVDCTIEYDDGDYYLSRFYESLEGLLVRDPR